MNIVAAVSMQDDSYNIEASAEGNPHSSSGSSSEDYLDIRAIFLARTAGQDGILEEKDQKQKQKQQQAPKSLPTTTSHNNSLSADGNEATSVRTSAGEGRVDNSPRQLEGNIGVDSEEFDVMKVVASRAREALQEEDEEKVEEEGAQEGNQGSRFPNKRGIPHLTMDGQEPGAYFGAPGADPHRCDDPRFSQVGVQHPTIASQESSVNESIKSTEMDNTNIGPANDEQACGTSREKEGASCSLVQANLIMEESLHSEQLATAQPVDSHEKNEEEQNAQKHRRLLWAGLGAALTILCLVVSLSLSYGGGGKSSGETLSPSNVPSSSIAPSSVPSAAPTIHLDLLIQNLPDSTLNSIHNVDKSQGKAYRWMVEETEAIGAMEVWRMKQLLGLATFYYSLGGPNWPEAIRHDWLDLSTPECFWFSSYDASLYSDGTFHSFPNASDSWYQEEEYPSSILCDSNGEFEALPLFDLAFIGLENYNPTIPPEIALLTKLELLHLSNVGIATSLSSLAQGILQLRNLQFLGLDRNTITGTISSAFGMLTSLMNLILDRNALSGTIPSELALMKSLEYIDLSDNQLIGPIPSELGLLKNLTGLYLTENALTGTIPQEVVCLAASGSDIYVNGNKLSAVTAPSVMCGNELLIVPRCPTYGSLCFSETAWNGTT